MSESMGVIYYEVDVDTGKLVNSTGTMDKSLDGLQKEFDKTDRQAGKFTGQMNKVAEGVKRANAETQGATSSINGLYKVLAGLVSLRAANSLIEMAESYNTYAERVRMATESQAEFEMVQRRLLDTANGTYRALSEAQEVYIRTADGLRDMGYSTEQALDITDSLSYAFVKNEASVDRANAAINAYSKSVNKGRVDAQAWESIIAAVPTVINDIAEASGRSAQEVRRLGAEGKITARDLNEGLRKSLDANRDAADGMATTVKDALTNLKNNLSVYLGEANKATGATTALSKAIVLIGDNIETIAQGLQIVAAGAAGYAVYSSAVRGAAMAQATFNAVTRANPVGLFLTVLGAGLVAIYQYTERQKGAASAAASHAEAIRSINQPLDEMVRKFREANEVQRQGFILQWTEEQRRAIESASSSFDELISKSQSALASQTRRGRRLSNAAKIAYDDFAEGAKEAFDAGEPLLPLLDKLAEERGIPTETLNSLKMLVVNMDSAQTTAKELQELLDQVSGGANREIPTQDSSDAQKRIEGLENEIELIKVLGIERARMAAEQAAGDAATGRQIIRIKELADELYRLKDMDDARQQIKGLGEQLSIASLRGEDLAAAQATLRLGEYVDPAQVQLVEELARAMYRAQNSLSMLAQADPLAGEEARYQQELENLRALNEAKILEDQRYLDLKAQAEKRYMENMRQLQEQNFRAQNEWNEILMATLDHVQQASTDAITGLLSGINNTREAMQMLAKAILREVVGAFVQMGISQVKAWVMGQAAQAAAGAAYAAAVAGQVAANTALASQAAYASTTAIPIVGPGLAPAAAVRAATEASALGAPAITAAAASAAAQGGMAAAGGRQYGGPVAAGSMYRVNENGRPEVFRASNGQQFMIPNSRGEVVSNSDAAGGGAATVVNLNIVESQDRGGEVERMDGPNGDVTITAFVSDIRRDGPASRALSQTFGLKRRGK